jgi:hypothetical protein
MTEHKRALGAVVVVLCVLLLVAVLVPLLQPQRQYGSGKSTCQTHIKELGFALKMYMDENGETLPSSAVCGTSDRVFRLTRGQLPPPERGCRTIFQLLYRIRMATSYSTAKKIRQSPEPSACGRSEAP